MPAIDLATLFAPQPQDNFTGSTIGLPFGFQLPIGS